MPANSGNPASGTLQSPLMVSDFNMTEAICDCAKSVPYDAVKHYDVDDYVKCMILGSKRDSCVKDKIDDAKREGKAKDVHTKHDTRYDSDALPEGKSYCVPDIVVGEGTPPLEARDMKHIYDLKFPCNTDGKLPSVKDWDPDKKWGSGQKRCYQRIKKPGGKASKNLKVEAIGPTQESCTQ